MRRWVTHCGLVMTYGSMYLGLPTQRQAIIWTNADLLSIASLETHFSEMWIITIIKKNKKKIKKMHFKMSPAKCRPFLFNPSSVNDKIWLEYHLCVSIWLYFGHFEIVDTFHVVRYIEVWWKWLTFCRWHYPNAFFSLTLRNFLF